MWKCCFGLSSCALSRIPVWQTRSRCAVSIFEQAIPHYPQERFAWADYGECLVRRNDLPRAEQSLRRASELSREPRVTEAWQQVRAKMG